MVDASDVNAELVGSWSTIIGDQDQAFHVWRYVGGYAEIDKARSTFAKNTVSSTRSKLHCQMNYQGCGLGLS